MKIVFFLQIYIFILGVFSCDVTEEGKSFEIRFTAKTPPEDGLMLSWYKDDKLLADCPIDTGDCTTVDVNWFHAHVDRQNDSVEFIVNIPNVSRNSSSNAKGLWTLKTHSSSPIYEILYTCMLQVYAKPDQVYCDAKWTTDELTITCKTKRIYPEAMMKVDIKNKTSKIISCENARISKEPYYYRAECSFSIPSNDLHFNKNEIDIYLYPNIIGFYNSIGVNVSIDITIEIPAVQGNICVDKGQYMACRCIRLHGRQDVKSVEWLLNNTTIASKGFQANFTKEQPENTYFGYNRIACKLQWENDDDHFQSMYLVTALAVLVLLLTATILLLLWCMHRTKKQKCVKSSLDDAVYYKSETKHSETCTEEENTAFICSKSGNINPEIDVTETVLSSKRTFDDEKSVLLLLRTRNTNEVDITKNVFQSKIRRLDTYTKTIQLDYFQFKDRIFKVVNIPEYDAKDKRKFRQMLNNSICLSPEGYSAFIIVFTAKEYKEANRIIYMLVGAFGKDVLSYLMVFLSDDGQGQISQNDIKKISDLCDGRYFVYDSNSDVCNIINTFVVHMNYLYVNNSFKTRFEKSQSYTGILLENIIQDICLMFQRNESFEKREKRKECLLQNWDTLKHKIDPSTCRFEYIQYLIDFCVTEKCNAESSQKNSKNISEDFEERLESVKYDHIRKSISDRTQFIGNF